MLHINLIIGSKPFFAHGVHEAGFRGGAGSGFYLLFKLFPIIFTVFRVPLGGSQINRLQEIANNNNVDGGVPRSRVEFQERRRISWWTSAHYMDSFD